MRAAFKSAAATQQHIDLARTRSLDLWPSTRFGSKHSLGKMLFAGSDAQLSPDEEAACGPLKGSLMKNVFGYWGTGCGFLVATSLSDMDITQKMVIKEDE